MRAAPGLPVEAIRRFAHGTTMAMLSEASTAALGSPRLVRYFEEAHSAAGAHNVREFPPTAWFKFDRIGQAWARASARPARWREGKTVEADNTYHGKQDIRARVRPSAPGVR